MTVTINRNLLIFLIALIALGVVGYFVGQQVVGNPQATGPTVVTATIPADVVAQASQPVPQVPTAAPDTAPRIEVEDFKKEFDAKTDMMVVDVRTPDAYAAGHIAGAVSIPEAEVAGRLSELPKDKHIVLYCA